MNLITSKNSVQLKFILLCSWVHLLSVALQTRDVCNKTDHIEANDIVVMGDLDAFDFFF